MQDKSKDIIASLDDNYLIIKKIGKGGTSKVYLGYDKKNKDTLYAFKIIKSENAKALEGEHLLLSQISDSRIIKSYSYSSNSIFIKKNKTTNVSYLRLEYIPYGELFDYVYYPRKGFGENLSRLIFHTLLLSIQSLHNQGIIHRDIKTENIMVDANNDIKLCDFGFASYNVGLFHSVLGTEGYASPEMRSKHPYYGISNDIFSLGITLFVIITGNMPFRLTTTNDPLYSLVANNRYEEYYKKRGIKLSDSFKEMFNMMVALNYEQRPTVEEILNCKWVKEGDYSEENYKVLRKEIENRRKIIEAKKSSLQNK